MPRWNATIPHTTAAAIIIPFCTAMQYCSLQVGCHRQWFMLDSVVSTVDIVWLALAIHGFPVLRNRYHVSLIPYALILVRYHKQARAVFTLVQWLCTIAFNRSSLLIVMELELEHMLLDSRDYD